MYNSGFLEEGRTKNTSTMTFIIDDNLLRSGNGTQGAGAALKNQTSKGLSNAAGSIMQRVKNLFGGSNGQK